MNPRGSRLTDRDLDRFPGRTLFDALARAVCHAGCLPRKELYEAWEVARRARRLFRGGRVIDMAGGHGLLAHAMLLLDDSSPSAAIVDTLIPLSAAKIGAVMRDGWPRLEGRVAADTGGIGTFQVHEDDVVVSSHACGNLTDVIIGAAIGAGAAVAVLPCCHILRAGANADLRGWLDAALAIDVARAERLRAAGYRVWTQTIPAGITPKNRLLLARPRTHSQV